MSREKIAEQMAKCIDQFDDAYDELADAWYGYFDRFCRRIEELVNKGNKSCVRGDNKVLEASEKEVNE